MRTGTTNSTWRTWHSSCKRKERPSRRCLAISAQGKLNQSFCFFKFKHFMCSIILTIGSLWRVTVSHFPQTLANVLDCSKCDYIHNQLHIETEAEFMWGLIIKFCCHFSHRLQQVDENRKSVTNEIKKSICNLIMEINRKGKILVNQLEVCFICTTEWLL